MLEIRIGRPFQNAVDPETGAVLIAGFTADDPDVRIVFDDYECAWEFLSNAADAVACVHDRELREAQRAAGL